LQWDKHKNRITNNNGYKGKENWERELKIEITLKDGIVKKFFSAGLARLSLCFLNEKYKKDLKCTCEYNEDEINCFQNNEDSRELVKN
jgi:hypothetical protein